MSELAFLPQPGLIFTLASFIAMIAVLVVVHEGGHYLAGRLFGAKIEAFGVGFGRELLGWTDRKINAIPLGGYVKFVGDMNEASQVDPAILSLPEKERRGLFAFLPLWQRAIIVAAGPAINFLFAILILAGFNLALGHQASPPVVERVMPGSAAERAGVAVGDRILSVDGKAVERFEDITAEIVTGTGNRVELLVQRGTAQRRIVVTPMMVDQGSFRQCLAPSSPGHLAAGGSGAAGWRARCAAPGGDRHVEHHPDDRAHPAPGGCG
jgi:regulator of sigma E protease